MSIAKRSNPVEGHTGSGTSQATGAFATSPVSGDTIIVFCAAGGSSTHNAPTDSTGLNTYTQIGTSQVIGTFSETLSVWKCENITGGSSFIVTGNLVSARPLTVIAWCLQGANTPTSYNGDTAAALNAGSANPDTGTTSPAPAANSFFVAGVITEDGNNAEAAGSGWEYITGSTQSDNTSFQDLYTEELTSPNTSSSAQNGTFTGASTPWAARVASFAPAPSAAVASVGRLPQMFHPGRGILRQARHRETKAGIILPSGVAYTLALASGTYTIVGTNVGLAIGHKVSATSGTYNVTGSTAGLAKGYKISAVSGTYTVTGTAVTLTATRKLSATGGIYNINGQIVGLKVGYKLSAASGSYVINGSTVGLKAARNIVVSSGSYLINGGSVILARGLKLSAASGSYNINGTDVTLAKSSHAYTLAAGSGSYTVTGTSVVLTAARKLTASSGSYILTGTSARATLVLDTFPPSVVGGGLPQIIND